MGKLSFFVQGVSINQVRAVPVWDKPKSDMYFCFYLKTCVGLGNGTPLLSYFLRGGELPPNKIGLFLICQIPQVPGGIWDLARGGLLTGKFTRAHL